MSKFSTWTSWWSLYRTAPDLCPKARDHLCWAANTLRWDSCRSRSPSEGRRSRAWSCPPPTSASPSGCPTIWEACTRRMSEPWNKNKSCHCCSCNERFRNYCFPPGNGKNKHFKHKKNSISLWYFKCTFLQASPNKSTQKILKKNRGDILKLLTYLLQNVETVDGTSLK